MTTTQFGNAHSTAYGMTIQSDGKIIAVGNASQSGNSDFALARYIGDFAAAAAEVSVGGRVTVSKNRGLSNAVVHLTDSSGATRSARTNQFGYYRFDEVLAGETYTLNISSKRFTFAPQTVNVMDEINNLNFAAEE